MTARVPSHALTALILVAALAARADQRLDEVVVTATPTPADEAVRDPTAFANVIETRDAPTGVETLAEVLSDSVGVQVRRFGGLGDFSTVSIRGSSSGQVQVYLDGVPLSRADNETVNLSDLPLDAVDHVEVYRSVTPLQFAQSGPGGVVNVVTRRPGATPLEAASASFGSFLTRKVDVARAATVGNWDYLAFGQYLGSRGDFPFPFAATPSAPEVTERRQNNDFNSGNLTARVGWRPSAPVTLALTGDTFGKEQGVPGAESLPALNTRLATVRQVANLEARVVPPAGMALDVTAGAYVVYTYQRFQDPDAEIAPVPEDDRQQTIGTGGQILARGALGAHQVPGVLLALGHERLAERDPLRDLDVPDRTRLRTTVAAEDEVLLLGDRLSLVPAVRWEFFRNEFPGDPGAIPPIPSAGVQDDDFVSPRLGLRAGPWRGVTLRANIGRWKRPPNLQELFGNSGNVVGNPNLEPETALNRDVGLRLVPPPRGPLVDAALEVVYFDNDIDDLILLVQQSQNVVRPENIGGAHVSGVEVSARGQLWQRLSIALNYTHQDSRDTSGLPSYDGNQLPGRPANEAYGRLQLDWSPAVPLPGVARLWPGRFWYDVNVIAGNYLNRANTEFIAQRFLQGVGIQVMLPLASLQVGFEVRNLGDDRQEDVFGFPLPGRSYFATVSRGFTRE